VLKHVNIINDKNQRFVDVYYHFDAARQYLSTLTGMMSPNCSPINPCMLRALFDKLAMFSVGGQQPVAKIVHYGEPDCQSVQNADTCRTTALLAPFERN
jgi:hypothetical protein